MNKKGLEKFHIDNILKAADYLFREFGYEQTTMDKIAKLANYSKTTIYAYFPSKEAVFFTIILQNIRILNKDFKAVIDKGESFVNMYYELCEVLVKMEKEKPVYFEGMIGHINMQLDNDDTPRVFREIFDEGNAINENLFRLLDKGIAEEMIQDDTDKEKAIFYLWSSITGIIRMCKRKADYFLLNNVTYDDMIRYCLENVLKSIVSIKI